MTNKWTLTDAHHARIPEWNAMWEERIMSLDPIDMDSLVPAIDGMYRAAKFEVVPVVYCLSPMMSAIVCAWASAYWATYDATRAATHDATRDATHAATSSATRAATHAATSAATYDATRAATYDATRAATHDATRDATHAATSSATYDATRAATRSATYDATYDATHAATRSATHAATYDATHAATRDATYDATRAATHAVTSAAVVRVMWQVSESVVCGKLPKSQHKVAHKRAFAQLARYWDYVNGGCEWASWCAYLSFVRDVVGWSHPTHEAYAHYEAAAIHGSFRFMHQKFCLVCEPPIARDTYRRNGRHVLHCEDGPAVQWRCGTRAWYLDGLAVDEKIVMHPETQTIAQIDGETNADIRQVRITRYGALRYLREIKAQPIDTADNDIEGTREALLRTSRGEVMMLATCPSGRHCPPLRVPSEIKTCEAARRWLAGDRQIRIIGRT